MSEEIREGEIREGEIRLLTYLAPSIPRELFEALAEHVRKTLRGVTVSLQVETRHSGPRKGVEDPFSKGEAELGFMCAPSFIWLRELRPPPVELLGVAPVFEDERNLGKPVYFCDIVVRRDGPHRTFSDLNGGSWAYNDACSLSGYYSLLKKLTESGADGRFFGDVFCSGSHLNSIEAVAGGEADAAAIDSNVLRIRLKETPALRERLRVIEFWGPFPIQPVVVRSTLHAEQKQRLRAALLSTEEDPGTRSILNRFGLRRFVPVRREEYAPDELAIDPLEETARSLTP